MQSRLEITGKWCKPYSIMRSFSHCEIVPLRDLGVRAVTDHLPRKHRNWSAAFVSPVGGGVKDTSTSLSVFSVLAEARKSTQNCPESSARVTIRDEKINHS
jgi:hypothetical protein